MKVCVIGVGLIGGSFALGLKESDPQVKVYGIDSKKEHLEKARDLNLIDAAGDMEEVKDADLVVVSVPVNATPAVLSEVLDLVAENCLVMDMGSTKEKICEAVAAHPHRRN